MPLKAICHSLVSNPHRLDAIAVMVGVDRLIDPVCQLLGAWPQEVDHSERFLFISRLVLTSHRRVSCCI